MIKYTAGFFVNTVIWLLYAIIGVAIGWGDTWIAAGIIAMVIWSAAGAVVVAVRHIILDEVQNTDVRS